MRVREEAQFCFIGKINNDMMPSEGNRILALKTRNDK
jgi:hypothetical protein